MIDLLLFQVEFAAVTNISLSISRDSIQASWASIDCAEKYIIRVRRPAKKKPPAHIHDDIKEKETLQSKEGSSQETAFMESFIDDDEDYEEEESGSGDFPIKESVHGNIYENNNNIKDTGFNYGYGNNLIIERENQQDSAEEEDYFETVPTTTLISTALYDYYDENYVETSKHTTPTSFNSDDEDYASVETGSGAGEIHHELIRAHEAPDIDIGDLEYYHEPDYVDDEDTNEWWRRKKRSSYDDDSSIEALLSLDDFSYENDEYMNDIERILSLDNEGNNIDNHNNTFFEIVHTNSGAINGLDSCTSYVIDVQAVYKYNVIIDSEEKEFHTLCQSPCETNGLDFKASIDKDAKKVVIEIENEPDCVVEYALKYCNNQNCGYEYNLVSTNSMLMLKSVFNPCLEYTLFLMPLFVRKEKLIEEINWDNAIFKLINSESSPEPPMPAHNSVGRFSHQNVNISWLQPNKCVDGYRISVFEIRHLPTVGDGKKEFLTFSKNLSSSISSLELSNLKSCRLYRAEIKSLYLSETGDFLAYFSCIFYTPCLL